MHLTIFPHYVCHSLTMLKEGNQKHVHDLPFVPGLKQLQLLGRKFKNENENFMNKLKKKNIIKHINRTESKEEKKKHENSEQFSYHSSQNL